MKDVGRQMRGAQQLAIPNVLTGDISWTFVQRGCREMSQSGRPGRSSSPLRLQPWVNQEMKHSNDLD